jgi:uncharacterized membrane protein YkoI
MINRSRKASKGRIMQKFLAGRLLGALCLLLLLALNQDWHALAQDLSKQSQPLGDLSFFRTIAADTLVIVNTGNLTHARARIKDLETKWDGAEAKFRPRNPERWRIIDNAIDAALSQLRADSPQVTGAKDALENLLTSLDQVNQSATLAPAASAAPESAWLSVTDIIAAAEKLQAGASVLDVSFEPKDGQPLYAVRTYANGKVWDGLLDGTTGAAIDQGTVMDESALDAEDKAELAALQGAKITLRQAIASAEKASGGRALNAGLEQVRGRSVWEILIQNTNQPQQIHIDPVSGKIL